MNAPVRRLRDHAAPRALKVRRTSPSMAVRHMTLPAHEVARLDMRPGESIHLLVERSEWAQRIRAGRRKVWSFQLPTICVLNGSPVLQRDWRKTRVREGDRLEFWSRPMGGGGSGSGKNVLGLVAVIALAAFAPWAGGALAGAFGLGSVGASIATGLITLGGALLISALTTPKISAQGDTQVDQLYSVSASGNTARLLQPIPVRYGRFKFFDDFAQEPWSEFEGNDQYLNVLLSVGLGTYSYENLYIDDTILWDSVDGVSDSFDGVQVAFYDPDEQIELFPTNVTQASEVNGQEVTTDYVGGYVANASGSTAKAFAFDYVFSAGCYSGTGGGISSASATIVAELQEVNDAGAAVGDWTVVSSATYTYATQSPVRLSVKVNAPSPGRYQARTRRADTPLDSSAGYNAVQWAGLRSFIDGPNTFPVSTVAIRIKANNQLTSAKKFGVLCTRILPVWNGSAWVDTATRSPAWAFYDAATNTTYGAARPASKVDFQAVYDLATAAASRGDNFDFRFSQGDPVPDVFDTILRSTRARHRWSGDVLTLVRDEWSDTPRMLLTDREIVRGSLSLEYILNTADSADAVIVDYLDQDTWSPASVQYPPNSGSFTSVRPTHIKLDGVVQRSQAYREAAFYYLQAQYRRIQPTLDTEHDGRMLGFGSRVRVQTELPQTWGYTGAVTGNESGTLTLSPVPTWAATGSHYIAIRTKTGRQFGPVLCTQGADASFAVLDPTDLATVEAAQATTLADTLDRADGADDPSFDFGVGSQRARDCIVMSGRPNGDHVTLALAVDNEAVHETSLGDTPVAPTVPVLRDPKAPVISAVSANFRQGVAEPILDASWEPAPGAIYYVAQVSYDGGASWTQIYEGNSTRLSARVDWAALRLRVQGVGERQGAWYTTDLDAPTITVASGVVDNSSLVAELQATLRQVSELLPDDLLTLRQDLDKVTTAINTQSAVLSEQIGRLRQALGVRYGENKAGVEEVRVATADQSSALAAIFNNLFATTGTGSAEALVRFTAASLPEGATASIALELRSSYSDSFASAGLYIDVGSFADGSTSRIRLKADNTNLEDSAGNVRRLMAAVIADTPNVVSIVSGTPNTATPDISNNVPVCTLLVDQDVQIRFPTGARLGFPFWLIVTQDGTGGHAVTYDGAAITIPGPTINTVANITTVLIGTFYSLSPPKMSFAQLGEPGQVSSDSVTIFSVSPAVFDKTVWNLAIDGDFEPPVGTYSITPLGNNGLQCTVTLWGPGGSSGAIGASVTQPDTAEDTSFAGVVAGAGTKTLSVTLNFGTGYQFTSAGSGGLASGGDTNDDGGAGGDPYVSGGIHGGYGGSPVDSGVGGSGTLVYQYPSHLDGNEGTGIAAGGGGGASLGSGGGVYAAIGGAGGGGKAVKTFGLGDLPKGTPFTLVVGAATPAGVGTGNYNYGSGGSQIIYAAQGAKGRDGRALFTA